MIKITKILILINQDIPNIKEIPMSKIIQQKNPQEIPLTQANIRDLLKKEI